MTDKTETREIRLYHMAKTVGLGIRKAPPWEPGDGTYRLVDYDTGRTTVASAGTDGYGLTLDQVETFISA